ncbi:MAG: FAD-dependent oxidoreductase [Acidimicrobiia bacterium]|nr:FAD-dependent oxidoreductase [Acidimicrobiia bacterium]
MDDRTRHVDVVVVGGGLAGLTAAALLGRAGRRVVLFERSRQTGGRAMTCSEGGFALNLGPHAWYPGGPGTRVLADLGVPLPGGVPGAAGVLAMRDGRLHTMPSGLLSLLTTDLLRARGKAELARLLARLPRLDASSDDESTLEAWLAAEVQDPVAREVVETFVRVASYAHAPDLLSAGAGLAAVQLVLASGVRYIHGGWQAIGDALAARARSLGVDIVTAAPVEEVLHDAAVEGVRLRGGAVVRTARVIMAGTPAMARALLPFAPVASTAAWSPVPARVATLDVGLTSLPAPDRLVAFGVDRPLYYSVHSAVADVAPGGMALIHLAKYHHPLRAHDARDDEAELEAFMDTLQPGWRVRVKTRRFLPSMTVAHAIPLANPPEGAAAGRRSALAARPVTQVAGIDGLFVAGDWVGPDGQLAHASVSSAAAAAAAASRLRGAVAA